MPLSPRLLRPRAAATTAFDPRSVADLSAWFDLSNTAQYALVSGAVSSVTDVTGTYTLTQATAASRPTISSINGRSAFSFNGTSNHLFSATSVASPFGTLFLVCVPTLTNNTSQAAFSFGRSSPSIAVTILGMPANASLLGVGGRVGGTSVARLTNNTVAGTAYALAATYDSAQNTALIVNDMGSALNGNTLTGNTAGMWLGSGAANGNPTSYFSGLIGDVLWYSRALTYTERLRVLAYLGSKWGITVSSIAPPLVSNPEAQNWIDRVYDNGGTVSASTAAAVNTFCTAIDAAGIRDRFYRLNLLCGDNIAAVMVPLYRSTSFGGAVIGNAVETNTGPYVTADYTETGSNGGLQHQFGKSLGTGLTASNCPQFATLHFGYSAVSSSGHRPIASVNTDGSSERVDCFMSSTPGGFQQFSIGLGQTSGAINYQPGSGTPVTRRMIASRTSSSRMDLYRDGVSVANDQVARTATSSGTTGIGMLGSVSFGSAGGRSRFYSFGAAMDSAQVANYDAALSAFLTAMGRV